MWTDSLLVTILRRTAGIGRAPSGVNCRHHSICSRLPGMRPRFHFTFEPDWRAAPLAFWVHVPTVGSTTGYVPDAPTAVLHRGFAVLHVSVADVDLRFSSLAQLDHFIDVMEAKPRPTSRQLSRKRASTAGPNGHWLSRLPATLKSPKEQAKLAGTLRAVRAQLVPLGDQWHRYPDALSSSQRSDKCPVGSGSACRDSR
jgi:hypothetical protein